MRKENDSPVCVYRNIEFEERTKKELQISKVAMEKILSEWLALGLGPCMGLNDLVLRPRAVFDRAVNEAIKVPELSAPFKLNPAQYREQLVLPDCSGLYNACKKALQLPYCAMYGIFIVNDDKVEIDEAGANDLIQSQTIYATNPDKIKLVEDLTKFVTLFNSLNERLGREFENPVTHATQFFLNKFSFAQKSYPMGIYELAILPDVLKRWLGL